ncbi:MAG TPA: glutamate-cysteine ligase family protein, partial [Myxococcota bacterium]|nr:glutamate-cysteine ligase family protein [Myxococcota bacterium]
MSEAEWASRLGRRFLERFPAAPRPWRTLGREAEYPVVHPDGTGADIRVLWPHLAEGVPHVWSYEGEMIIGVDLDGVSWTSEVGRGTIEAVLGPFDTLHAMRDAHERAVSRLVRAADREGLVVLGYGIQPVTQATPEWMTPKRRYQVLLDTLGETWLWFTLTASDQCHVAVSRDEVLPITNLTNLLTPVSIALLAGSPVYGGADSGFCSAREATMGRIHAGTFRHGMPGGPAADAEAWVRRSFGLEYLMHKDEAGIHPVGRPFGAWLDGAGLDEDAAFAAWQYHDHYMWNSTRPRTAHGTVELRSPCQQPWHEHMAAAALGAGLVCGWRKLAAFVDATLGDDAWAIM